MTQLPPQSHKRTQSDQLRDYWSDRVLGAAIAVHRELGAGLMESAYASALGIELRFRDIPYEREVLLPVEWRGEPLEARYRLDFLVAGSLVVEVKAVERILAVHEAQLLTYLKLGRFNVGLLLNFCAPLLRDGIVRRVL